MNEIQQLAVELGKLLRASKIRVTTAESCTGGGIAQAITDVEGCSQWFSHGFITYSNRAKQQLLGVEASSLLQQGAVSSAVVEAMAVGALASASADLAVAVSGVAGPGGGSDQKPVGTVWLAWATDKQAVTSQCFHFSGDREAIRRQSVIKALAGLINTVKNTV